MAELVVEFLVAEEHVRERERESQSVHTTKGRMAHPHGPRRIPSLHHLNFMRLVQMSGGKKKDATSLEMPVSVVIAPHQIFVRRACQKQSRSVSSVIKTSRN